MQRLTLWKLHFAFDHLKLQTVSFEKGDTKTFRLSMLKFHHLHIKKEEEAQEYKLHFNNEVVQKGEGDDLKLLDEQV